MSLYCFGAESYGSCGGPQESIRKNGLPPFSVLSRMYCIASDVCCWASYPFQRRTVSSCASRMICCSHACTPWRASTEIRDAAPVGYTPTDRAHPRAISLCILYRIRRQQERWRSLQLSGPAGAVVHKLLPFDSPRRPVRSYRLALDCALGMVDTAFDKYMLCAKHIHRTPA